MIIIFLGPPGSGKGTQAAIIGQKLSIPTLSTSAMLHAVISAGGKLAVELKNFMDNGELVPSTLVNEIVATTIIKDEYKAGCIFDGYPRTIDQAEFLDIRFPNLKIAVAHFDIGYEILEQRIDGRFTCLKCGAIYNKYLALPQKENECDICGSHDFKIRNDDKIEILRQRWEIYLKETKPLVEYYMNKGCLFNVNANLDKDKITDVLLSNLEAMKNK